jgi:hypothetical protein
MCCVPVFVSNSDQPVQFSPVSRSAVAAIRMSDDLDRNIKSKETVHSSVHTVACRSKRTGSGAVLRDLRPRNWLQLAEGDPAVQLLTGRNCYSDSLYTFSPAHCIMHVFSTFCCCFFINPVYRSNCVELSRQPPVAQFGTARFIAMSTRTAN